jgi:CDP-glycerol glycerophosphotransferase
VRSPTAAEMIGAQLAPAHVALLQSSAKKKVLMAPTQNRDNVLYVTTTAFYERLKTWARKHNAVVFVKTHPAMKAAHVAGKDAAALVPEEPGVLHVLDPEADVYPWLSRFDAMITDYSSIMFDFLLLRRPIFTYDTRTQFADAVDPDYTLIPDAPFRYEFRGDNFETVMNANLDSHPLRASQESMCGELYETPANEACAQLIQALVQLGTQSVEKNYRVITPKPAAITRAA